MESCLSEETEKLIDDYGKKINTKIWPNLLKAEKPRDYCMNSYEKFSNFLSYALAFNQSVKEGK